MKRTLILSILSFFLLVGCGPAVKLQRLKPAEVNMSSMRRLAVLDFEYSDRGYRSVGDLIFGIIAHSVGVKSGTISDEQAAASYGTERLIGALLKTDYFTIIDASKLYRANPDNPGEVKQLCRKLGIEALLTARIDSAECNLSDFVKEETVINPQTQQKTTVTLPWKQQNCELLLSYRIIRPEDNAIIAQKSFSEYHRDAAPLGQVGSLTDPTVLYQQMLDTIISKIPSQLVPYTVTETRFLKEDKSYDPEMKKAITLAEAGNIREARKLYLQRWQVTGNIAAGYNAALLLEVEGKLTRAKKLLDEMLTRTGDSSIVRERRRVVRAIEEQKQAEKQLR